MALQFLSLAGKGLSALGKRRAAKKARRQAQPQTGQQVAEKVTGRKQESVDKRQNPPISFDSPVTMNVSESTGRSSRTATTVEGVALQIETKTIHLKDALRRSLILDKAHEKNKQIISKKAKRTKAEEDAEKGSPKGKRFSLPIPGAKKVASFWERIKDFFITILWGWIAVRLVDKTELLGNLLPKIGAAVDWVIDAGIKFLDFAGTALMWGYAAYDWTRMQIGNVFGEDALEAFDGFMGHLNKVINGVVAIGIGFAAMALAWPKGPGLGRGPKPKGPQGKPRSWQNRTWRFPWEKAPVTKGKGGGNWFTKLQQQWFKRNPKVTVGKGGAGKGLFGFLKNIKLPVPKWLTGWKGNAFVNALLAYFEWKGRREEGQSRKKALAGTAASTVGGFAGFWAGAKIGAVAGAAIGAPFAGVGAGPGAIIGGIIGGIAGSMGGSWLAGSASDAIIDQIEKPKEGEPIQVLGGVGVDSIPKSTQEIDSSPAGTRAEGSKLAGELGRFLDKKGLGAWGSGVHQHPEHPPWPRESGHRVGSLHYASQGARAIDIGGWGPNLFRRKGEKGVDDQTKIIEGIRAFEESKGGLKRAEFAHEGNDPTGGHDDHVHIAYHKGGEVPGTGERWAKLLGGEMVIDVDSAQHKPVKNMLLAINEASTYEGVVNAIRKFAPYDARSPETIMIPSIPENLQAISNKGTEVVALPMFQNINELDPFEFLYKGS